MAALAPIGRSDIASGPFDTNSRRFSFLHPKHQFRVACWNVRSLMFTGAKHLLIADIKRYGIGVCGISETRWKDSGVSTLEDFTFISSGSKNGQAGVALVLDREASLALKEHSCMSERLISARFKTKHASLTIIQVYAPTDRDSSETVEAFYNDLQRAVDKVAVRDMLIILGDFNARTGRMFQLWPNVLGQHGVGQVNGNGLKLLSFCASNDLSVSNTFFMHKSAHKYTWQHPGGRHKHMIDYVLVNRRFLSSVLDTRVFRGACSVDSDHYLVVSSIRVKLSRSRLQKKSNGVKRVNVEALRQEPMRDKFQYAVGGRFASLLELGDAEFEWDALRSCVTESAVQTVGFASRQRRKPFLSEATVQLAARKREAFLAVCRNRTDPHAKALYTELKKQTRISARSDLNAHLRSKASEIEALRSSHRIHHFFRSVKALGVKLGGADLGTVTNKGGTLLHEESDVLHRWTEHFSELLNCESHVDPSTYANLPPPPPLPTDTPPPTPTDTPPPALSSVAALDGIPSLDDVQAAIDKLQNYKAAGCDGVFAEMLKAGGSILTQWVHRIITVVWHSGTCPVDWKRALITPLFKKGDRSSCDNYRGISVLSVVGKVYTHLLLDRVSKCVEHKLSELQSGFRPNRGCPDQIFTLTRAMELSWEFDVPMYMCFIDLRKAYDSVDREALWHVLKVYGIPDKLIGLLRDLHEGTVAAVKWRGNVSDWFEVRTGVRQGCVIAPLLFNIFIDYIVREALHDVSSGFRLGYRVGNRITWARTDKPLHEVILQLLLYADDMVLICDCPNDLKMLIERIDSITQKWGMCINVAKTKIMCMHRGCNRGDHMNINISIRGMHVEVVNDFTYLGKIVNCHNTHEGEVVSRIALASKAFQVLRPFWSNKHVNLSTKIAVYKAVVVPCLLYAVGTWATLPRHVHKLEVAHNAWLRKILGISIMHHVQVSAIRARCANMPSMSQLITIYRMRWLGHLMRLNTNRICKQMLFAGWVVNAKRPRGGPRKRWNNLAHDDITKCLKLPARVRWYDACLDRVFWDATVVNAVLPSHG